MSIASSIDVETALGRSLSTDEEIQQVIWWLDGVELFLRSRLGDIDLLDEDAVRYVEAEAVAAKVRRSGRDESSITVQVDDGAVTRRYDNPVTADDIAPSLWDLLSPVRSASAYTVGISSPLDLA